MREALRVLLVEDSPDDAELVLQELVRAGLDPDLHRVDSANGMNEALVRQSWDIVISDYNLPGFSGADALNLVRQHSSYVPFILVSGRIGEEEAVAMMKAGADDYVMKDRLMRLAPAVERSLREGYNRLQSRMAQLALRESEARFKAIVSNMPGMVFQLEFEEDGRPRFIYVSDGCVSLLGVSAAELQRGAAAFLDRVLPEDQTSCMASMQAARKRRSDWNWEGRISVPGSKDIKWVDLRSRLRLHDDASTCWDGFMFNVTQNKMADLEIRRSRAELARLSAHVETVKEYERATIAREIHDDLGGTLTAIKIMLLRLGQGMAPDAEQALHQLQSTESLVDSAMDVARRIASELRPGILDLGIVAAIEWQAAEFSKRMDMDCLLTCAHNEIPLESGTSMAVFRTLQEALTNIAKHANATRVEVELEMDDNSVQLQVHDNGRGIASEDLSKLHAFGILGMRERARSLGGEAGIRRTRAGTAVTLRLPLAAPAAEPYPIATGAPGADAHAAESFIPPPAQRPGSVETDMEERR